MTIDILWLLTFDVNVDVAGVVGEFELAFVPVLDERAEFPDRGVELSDERLVENNKYSLNPLNPLHKFEICSNKTYLIEPKMLLRPPIWPTPPNNCSNCCCDILFSM